MLPIDALVKFRDKYYPDNGSVRNILDVGSLDPDMKSRKVFTETGWIYIGLDIRPGPSVDMIPNLPYSWNLRANIFDTVISNHAFEHIEYPWLTICEMARVMRVGAYCCIIVPSIGTRHRQPYDYWRMKQRGVDALGKWAGLNMKENYFCTDDWRSVVYIGEKH